MKMPFAGGISISLCEIQWHSNLLGALYREQHQYDTTIFPMTKKCLYFKSHTQSNLTGHSKLRAVLVQVLFRVNVIISLSFFLDISNPSHVLKKWKQFHRLIKISLTHPCWPFKHWKYRQKFLVIFIHKFNYVCNSDISLRDN